MVIQGQLRSVKTPANAVQDMSTMPVPSHSGTFKMNSNEGHQKQTIACIPQSARICLVLRT